MTQWTFHDPVELRFGRGAARGLIADLPGPLMVVSGEETLARAGLASEAKGRDDVELLTGVPPRAGVAEVEQIVAAVTAYEPATLLAVGGGSVLDVARTAAACVGNAESVEDLLALGPDDPDLMREVTLVVVPTTAAGSEVSRRASLWGTDGARHVFDHEAGFADLAVIDPALLEGLDPLRVASSGLGAMGLSMEALWNVRGQPLSALHAGRALALVTEHLLPAIAAAASGDPAPVAQDALALASVHAGLAAAGSDGAAAHALCDELVGRHRLQHGLAYGLMCRAVLPVTARWAPAALDAILSGVGASSVEGACDLIDAVFGAAGSQPSLAALGVSGDALPGVADAAMMSPRLADHPARLSYDELVSVLAAVG